MLKSMRKEMKNCKVLTKRQNERTLVVCGSLLFICHKAPQSMVHLPHSLVLDMSGFSHGFRGRLYNMVYNY